MTTATNSRTIARTLLSAACVLALAAGSATAQSAGGGATDEPRQDAQKDFKQPLRAKRSARVEGRPAQPQARSIMTLRQSEGDDEYEVVIEGDQVTSAKVNGKDLPEKRIRRSDDRVELLDKDGNVMTTFMVGRAGHWSNIMPLVPGQPMMPNFPQGVTGWTQPKVMIGINMGDLPEEMADQLKLDAGEVVFISRVLPDSPAAKAGLKERDVVVAINGERPATREKVAEAVRGKDPGDDIAFTVIRAGKERTIKVELAKYDPEVMQSEFQGVQGLAVPQSPEQQQEFMQKFKELSRRQGRPGAGGQGGSWFFDPGDENSRFFTPSQAPRAESPELKARLKELDARMAELDKKMTELTARLEKLNASLEQRRDRSDR